MEVETGFEPDSFHTLQLGTGEWVVGRPHTRFRPCRKCLQSTCRVRSPVPPKKKLAVVPLSPGDQMVAEIRAEMLEAGVVPDAKEPHCSQLPVRS
jgi:hypothetical protein